MKTIITNIENTLKIPHLKIAHQGGNLEVGNLDIQGYQDCPPQLFVVFCAYNGSGQCFEVTGFVFKSACPIKCPFEVKENIERPDF